MSNLINANLPTNQFIPQHKKEREGTSLEFRNEKMHKTHAISEHSQRIDKKDEEQKNKDKVENVRPQRGDYRDLLDRIAEQEVKKNKISAFTSNQKELLKQVENTISPTSKHSYDLKV